MSFFVSFLQNILTQPSNYSFVLLLRRWLAGSLQRKLPDSVYVYENDDRLLC